MSGVMEMYCIAVVDVLRRGEVLMASSLAEVWVSATREAAIHAIDVVKGREKRERSPVIAKERDGSIQ